jgi:hypothetical protein
VALVGRLPPETIGTPPKGKMVHPWEYDGETKFRMEWNRINGGMRMKTIVYALKNMRNIKNKTPFSLFAVGSNTPPFRAVRIGNVNKKW